MPHKSVKSCIEQLLDLLGENPDREGLVNTPGRVARFYTEHFKREPVLLTTFKNEGTDELIIQTQIPFYSLCEHHIVPFFGMAAVAYLPGDRIVGLSKLARLVQYHARGVQNQERITKSVADSLEELQPKAIGVILRARHLCMEMRGVRTPGAETITSDLRGALRIDPKARAEFMTLVKGH
jgi:GTP cyclohydrolase I